MAMRMGTGSLLQARMTEMDTGASSSMVVTLSRKALMKAVPTMSIVLSSHSRLRDSRTAPALNSSNTPCAGRAEASGREAEQ